MYNSFEVTIQRDGSTVWSSSNIQDLFMVNVKEREGGIYSVCFHSNYKAKVTFGVHDDFTRDELENIYQGEGSHLALTVLCHIAILSSLIKYILVTSVS